MTWATVRNAEDFENVIGDLLECPADFVDMDEGEIRDEDTPTRVYSFHEAGVLSLNRGLLVRLPNGAEFQLTIVQSKRAERKGVS